MTDVEQAVKVLQQLTELKDTNRIHYYHPYGYQVEFHKARDLNKNRAKQRLLMAANKVGKTYCGAAELAIHALGDYPDWWEGHKFDNAIKIWAAGNTTANTRDIVQAELLGEPGDPEDYGKGLIPKDRIVHTDRLPGIPNAYSAVTVRHASGKNSKIWFKSYEQGKEQWMGKAVDIVWLDEEPPQDIYSQGLRATLKTQGLIFMTFTPEKGMTNTVAQFMNDLKPGQQLYHATWDDAPHLDEQTRNEILAALPPHERNMRSKGFLFLVQDWFIRLTKTLSRSLRFRFQNTGLKSVGLTLVGIIHLLQYGLHGIVKQTRSMSMTYTQYVLKHLLLMPMQYVLKAIGFLWHGLMMVCNMTKVLAIHLLNSIVGLVLICLVAISAIPTVVFLLSQVSWTFCRECSQGVLKYLNILPNGLQKCGCTIEKKERSLKNVMTL